VPVPVREFLSHRSTKDINFKQIILHPATFYMFTSYIYLLHPLKFNRCNFKHQDFGNQATKQFFLVKIDTVYTPMDSNQPKTVKFFCRQFLISFFIFLISNPYLYTISFLKNSVQTILFRLVLLNQTFSNWVEENLK